MQQVKFVCCYCKHIAPFFQMLFWFFRTKQSNKLWRKYKVLEHPQQSFTALRTRYLKNVSFHDNDFLWQLHPLGYVSLSGWEKVLLETKTRFWVGASQFFHSALLDHPPYNSLPSIWFLSLQILFRVLIL